MKQKNKLTRLLYLLIFLFIVICALFFYKSALTYILLASLFAFIFNPLVTLIENLGIRRVFAVILFYLIFFVNVFILGSIFFPIIIKQISSLSETFLTFIHKQDSDFHEFTYLKNLLDIWDNLKELFPFVNFETFKNLLLEKSIAFAQKIPTFIMASTSKVMKLFSYMAFVPIIAFFLLKDHIHLKNTLFSLIPNKYFEITLIIFDKINTTLGKYLRALLIQTSIIMTLDCIVLVSLGVRFGLLVGFIAGILNMIPFLGPFIGICIGVLTVVLTGGSAKLIIWTILGMWFVQLLDNSVVYPSVMGRNTNMPPVVIVVTVISGSMTYGVIGMLLAVPTLFLAKELIRVIYKNLKQFGII